MTNEDAWNVPAERIGIVGQLQRKEILISYYHQRSTLDQINVPNRQNHLPSNRQLSFACCFQR